MKNIIAKWVERLRSGEVEEGTLVLRDTENRFCCLGVLCDIVGVSWELTDEDAGAYTADGLYQILPAWVRLATGVSSSGEFDWSQEMDDWAKERGLKMKGSLAALNDACWTFAEIADFIETFTPAIVKEEEQC